MSQELLQEVFLCEVFSQEPAFIYYYAIAKWRTLKCGTFGNFLLSILIFGFFVEKTAVKNVRLTDNFDWIIAWDSFAQGSSVRFARFAGRDTQWQTHNVYL